MRAVKSRDTKREMRVRSLLHRMGYRFRLHRKDLPGKPDIVLPRHKKAIFVHGCFWHGHAGCKEAARPATNAAYWNAKLDRNKARAARALQEIQSKGWQPLVVWECQTREIGALEQALARFLTDGEPGETL